MKTFTLIKKELRNLFFSPLSLILISVLNIIPIIVFVTFLKANQTGTAYAGFENIVSFMVLVFALVIPVTSIISVCREKKNGTEEFLFSMPISRTDIVLSKIFSQIIFFALPTAIMAVFPFIFKSFGEVNLLHAYTALIMLEAFEIFIVSLCVMISSRIGKTVISFVISYSVIVLSFVSGVLSSLVRFLPFGTGFDRIFGGILFELSIFKKADTVVYELFDWTALFFFIVGAVIFTFIAIAKIKRNLATALLSVILVACVGVLPLLLPYSIRQIDVSTNKIYTTDESAKEYFASIDEEITVYLVNPYANEQEFYNSVVRMLEPYENIKLKIVNSVEDKEFVEKHELGDVDASLLSYAMVIEGSKRSVTLGLGDCLVYYNKRFGYLTVDEFQQRAKAYANVINQYGSYYDQMDESMKSDFQKIAQLLDSLQYETVSSWNLENVFAEAVSYVLADIPQEYLFMGHGEEVNAGNTYDFKANGSIPEDAELIVINSPSEDYSESEVNTVIDYIDNGGKLYMLTDVDNYSMPNLMRLLAHYGLSVENSVISVEEKDVLPISVNRSHEAFSGMSASEVTMKGVSKITVSEDSGYTYSPMLSYKHTEGEGDNTKVTEYPVSISVSKGDEKKITLFTGAVTFNSNDNGISEEELARVSPCVSYTMAWMFDGVELEKLQASPKVYQKLPYTVENAQIIKITVALVALTLAITFALTAYIVSRRLRSKRAIKSEE